MSADHQHPTGGGTIRFVLNGERRAIAGVPPDLTVLRWLRDHARLTGTKEGCAEGDCGACTVVIGTPDGRGGLLRRSENACIRLLPQLHGLSVETVEHLGEGREGGLHPVQRELIERHGSQCGFCTPGIAMQLYGAHENGRLRSREEVVAELSGNLCRCTGYGPIVEAGEAVGREPPLRRSDDARVATALAEIAAQGPLRYEHGGVAFHQPTDADALSDLVARTPGATILAGGTDVGLWVAKLHRKLEGFVEINRVEGLDRIEETAEGVRVHAAASHRAFHEAVRDWHPDLDILMRRFAGAQTRSVGTVCGNVANGSPIGDLNPTLIALGATVNLRRGDARRTLPVEALFLDYMKQDRAPGEWIESIDVPRPRADDLLHVSKISKRIASDISAVLGAFRLRVEDGRVHEARLAFGGMAATARRAPGAEAALLGCPFDAEAVEAAAGALADDFTPLTDMRASAAYRTEVAANLLRRFLREAGGATTLGGLGPMPYREAAE